MSVIIEVMETNNSHLPKPRTIKGQNGKGDRVVYDQTAFAHLGGVFPVEMRLTHNDHNEVLEVGKYLLHPSSFKVGRYGGLEIDNFNMVLEKYNASK